MSVCPFLPYWLRLAFVIKEADPRYVCLWATSTQKQQLVLLHWHALAAPLPIRVYSFVYIGNRCTIYKVVRWLYRFTESLLHVIPLAGMRSESSEVRPAGSSEHHQKSERSECTDRSPIQDNIPLRQHSNVPSISLSLSLSLFPFHPPSTKPF